tara:strand:- start:573 stop:1889 length:1317 start_codon:yes stop_codon:yes gene_type:complete
MLQGIPAVLSQVQKMQRDVGALKAPVDSESPHSHFKSLSSSDSSISATCKASAQTHFQKINNHKKDHLPAEHRQLIGQNHFSKTSSVSGDKVYPFRLTLFVMFVERSLLVEQIQSLVSRLLDTKPSSIILIDSSDADWDSSSSIPNSLHFLYMKVPSIESRWDCARAAVKVALSKTTAEQVLFASLDEVAGEVFSVNNLQDILSKALRYRIPAATLMPGSEGSQEGLGEWAHTLTESYFFVLSHSAFQCVDRYNYLLRETLSAGPFLEGICSFLASYCEEMYFPQESRLPMHTCAVLHNSVSKRRYIPYIGAWETLKEEKSAYIALQTALSTGNSDVALITHIGMRDDVAFDMEDYAMLQQIPYRTSNLEKKASNVTIQISKWRSNIDRYLDSLGLQRMVQSRTLANVTDLMKSYRSQWCSEFPVGLVRIERYFRLTQ